MNLNIFGYIIIKSLYDLKVEFRKGRFGLISWLFEPLLYLAGFYFIFVIVFQRMAVDRVPSLLLGLLVWKWFSSSLTKISSSIKANKKIFIRKKLPIWTFAVSCCVSETIKFILAIVIFLTSSFFVFGDIINIDLLSFFILIVFTSCFILFLGFGLALIVPFFGELRVIIPSCLTIGLFISGVIFDVSKLGPDKIELLEYNPMFQVIRSFKDVVFEGRFVSSDTVLYVTTVSAILWILVVLTCRLIGDKIWVQP